MKKRKKNEKVSSGACTLQVALSHGTCDQYLVKSLWLQESRNHIVSSVFSSDMACFSSLRKAWSTSLSM